MDAHREMTRQADDPGEILHEEFLKPLGMSQKELALHLGCDVEGRQPDRSTDARP